MYLASGKLAAVMHVAVILQDCLARHTVIVLAKPYASILSPNMMRMKLDMIMRMKVIVWRKRGVRENCTILCFIFQACCTSCQLKSYTHT